MRNEQVRARARQKHNAKTKVLPLNINIGDFVMVRVNAKRGHKLQTKWKGPMQVTETKSHLLFVVEDINRQYKMIAHAQRLIPYPVTSKQIQASKELQQQAIYYETMTHIVKEIRGVRERDGEYEVLVEWLGCERSDDTWEPVQVMVEDVPGLVQDYLYTAGERNIKKKILDLYF